MQGHRIPRGINLKRFLRIEPLGLTIEGRRCRRLIYNADESSIRQGVCENLLKEVANDRRCCQGNLSRHAPCGAGSTGCAESSEGRIPLLVEAGADFNTGYRDADYVEKGARLAPSRAELFRDADVIAQVLCYGSNDPTGKNDLALYRCKQTVIGFQRPFGSLELALQLAASGVTSFSVELMPRITRAQSTGELSCQRP